MTLARSISVICLVLPAILLPSAAHAQLGNPSQDAAPFPITTGSSAAPPVTEKRIAAPEPPAPRFGSKGEVVLTAASGGANSAGISYAQYGGSQATYLATSFEAGVDYFVADHLSIGFDLGAGYSNDTGYGADGSFVRTKSTTVAGGVRLGVDVPLGDTFSFYPRLTLGITDTHSSEGVISGSSASIATSAVGASSSAQVGPWMNLYAPLLVHPTPHFFLGVGPRVVHTFANTIGAAPGVSGQPTALGASFVIGGWWGGDDSIAPASTEPPASRETHVRRFGDAGTFVITNETDGGALATSFAGTTSSRLGVFVEPGVDYFFVDHLSIGLDPWISYAKSVGLDPNGAKVSYTTTSFGIAARFGAELSITDSVSWYARGEVGLGSVTEDEIASGMENQHTSGRVFVSLEAPLLAHVARHFFVGAGPSISHDLTNTDQNGVSNPATTFGASVLVGGWL